MEKVLSVSFLLFILIACSTSEKNADIPKFIQVQSKGLSTSKVEVKVEGSQFTQTSLITVVKLSLC